MGKYIPQPIDTSQIILPNDIEQLTELLAKNTHDVWALQRIKDGWTYGAMRDDDKKQHPCLVEYTELPEEEKVYDRNTAKETLKLINAMGYELKQS